MNISGPLTRPSRQRVALMAMVAGLASAAVLSSSAKGSQAVVNGPIVFQATVSGLTQLFTINPDGTGLRQVTQIPSADSHGAEYANWSPDGSTIIFDSDHEQTPPDHIVSVFTIKPDGSGLARLPIAVGPFDGVPAYSPEGNTISFDFDSSATDPHTGGIDIANADGSNVRRVTTRMQTGDFFDDASNWSPNGQWIAFTRASSGERAHAVFKVRLNGTGLKRLTPWSMDAGEPKWSPDGRKILFHSHQEDRTGQHANVYTMRPDGTHRIQLTHYDKGTIQARGANWSPDGKWIVFHLRGLNPDGPVKNQLFIMRANGKGTRQLTHLPHGSDPSSAAWGPLG